MKYLYPFKGDLLNIKTLPLEAALFKSFRQIVFSGPSTPSPVMYLRIMS